MTCRVWRDSRAPRGDCQLRDWEGHSREKTTVLRSPDTGAGRSPVSPRRHSTPRPRPAPQSQTAWEGAEGGPPGPRTARSRRRGPWREGAAGCLTRRGRRAGPQRGRAGRVGRRSSRGERAGAARAGPPSLRRQVSGARADEPPPPPLSAAGAVRRPPAPAGAASPRPPLALRPGTRSWAGPGPVAVPPPPHSGARSPAPRVPPLRCTRGPGPAAAALPLPPPLPHLKPAPRHRTSGPGLPLGQWPSSSSGKARLGGAAGTKAANHSHRPLRDAVRPTPLLSQRGAGSH